MRCPRIRGLMGSALYPRLSCYFLFSNFSLHECILFLHNCGQIAEVLEFLRNSTDNEARGEALKTSLHSEKYVSMDHKKKLRDTDKDSYNIISMMCRAPADFNTHLAFLHFKFTKISSSCFRT